MTFLCFLHEMQPYEIASICLQAVGLLVLIFYTRYTYRIMKTSEENTFLTRRLQERDSVPILVLTIGATPHPPGQMDTPFFLQNTTRYNAKAWITVEAKINGTIYDWTRINEKKYSGLEPWPVPAFAQVKGHFDFSRILPTVQPSSGHTLAINVKYKWADMEGKIQEGMDQPWYYDFARRQWVFDI